jgi:hypothetical protein
LLNACAAAIWGGGERTSDLGPRSGPPAASGSGRAALAAPSAGPLPSVQGRTAGELSPDGRHYWDGMRWVGAVSPDLRWRWNGIAWVPADPPAPAWAGPFASPERLATIATIAIALAVVQRLFTAASDAAPVTEGVVGMAVGIVEMLLLLSFIAAAIAVPMWCHRAYRNLPALGGLRLSSTPAMAAAGWFVPLTNLFQLYLLLREIWQHSRPSNEPWTLLKLYWSAWILGGGAGVFLTLRVNGVGITLPVISNLLLIPAGVLAILVLRRLTRWQVQKSLRASPPSQG